MDTDLTSRAKQTVRSGHRISGASTPIQISFILVNFNMAGFVRRAIQNIRAVMPPLQQLEIIIADNSTDGAFRLAPSEFSNSPDVTLVQLAENRGFVDALNRVIPLARAQSIMIMHPDVELSADCLASLVAFLGEHPRAGVVSPDLCYPDGTPNKIRTRVPRVSTESRRLFNMLTYIMLRRKFLSDEIFWDRSGETSSETVMSVCMLFRREALMAVQPIDSRIVFYYSNDLLCHRLRAAGWTCHYTPQVRAIHFERYAAKQMYGGGDVMEYKRSTIAASPRMRADYLAFLALCYPRHVRIVLRCIAVVEDIVQLIAQLKTPRKRRREIKQLLSSLVVVLGLSAAGTNCREPVRAINS